MKYIVILVLALANLASASANTLTFTLSAGHWLIKNTKQVYYVRVQAVGNSPQNARANGFRKAIELAVGTLVLGQSETVNQNLVRNDIITYSSGYVDDFKIISEVGNTVVMDVWVSDSKIANRLESMGVSVTSRVNGQEIQKDWQRRQAQNETITARQNQSKDLAKTVLDDYPRMAFKIKTINSRMTEQSGRPVFVLRYEIGMDERYADSLKEVLINTRRGRMSGSNNRDIQLEQPFFNFTRAHWENDEMRKIWEKTFFEREPFLKVKFDNENSWCWSMMEDLDGKMFGTIPNSGTMVINARHSFRVDAHIDSDGYDAETFVNMISNAGNAEATVVEKRDCL